MKTNRKPDPDHNPPKHHGFAATTAHAKNLQPPLRQDVGGGMWDVECGMWDVESGMWKVEGGCGMWNVECGMWNVECGNYFILFEYTLVFYLRFSIFVFSLK